MFMLFIINAKIIRIFEIIRVLKNFELTFEDSGILIKISNGINIYTCESKDMKLHIFRAFSI